MALVKKPLIPDLLGDEIPPEDNIRLGLPAPSTSTTPPVPAPPPPSGELRLTFASTLTWSRKAQMDRMFTHNMTLQVPREAISTPKKLTELVQEQTGAPEDSTFWVTLRDGTFIRSYRDEEWRAAVVGNEELVVNLKVVGTDKLKYS